MAATHGVLQGTACNIEGERNQEVHGGKSGDNPGCLRHSATVMLPIPRTVVCCHLHRRCDLWRLNCASTYISLTIGICKLMLADFS